MSDEEYLEKYQKAYGNLTEEVKTKVLLYIIRKITYHIIDMEYQLVKNLEILFIVTNISEK